MPNLVVYVPADVARVLEAKGVSEDLQRKACKEVLVGLASGELAAGVPGAVADPDGRASRPAPAASPRKCVREKLHHVNHSGKPCPECGYPLKEGAVT